MANGSLLDDLLTESELLAELKKKLGEKTPTLRTLSKWRNQRRGPAWTKLGRQVMYRRDAIGAWLKDGEHQPARRPARRSA